jgi:hypothetical protein
LLARRRVAAVRTGWENAMGLYDAVEDPLHNNR